MRILVEKWAKASARAIVMQKLLQRLFYIFFSIFVTSEISVLFNITR